MAGDDDERLRHYDKLADIDDVAAWTAAQFAGYVIEDATGIPAAVGSIVAEYDGGLQKLLPSSADDYVLDETPFAAGIADPGRMHDTYRKSNVFRATIKGTRIPVALRVFENQALKPEEGEGDGGFEALSASEAVQDLVSQKPANRLLRPLQAFMGPATTASKEKNKDRPTVWMVMPFHPVGSLVSMMRTKPDLTRNDPVLATSLLYQMTQSLAQWQEINYEEHNGKGHCGVTPGNFIITRQGRVLLGDEHAQLITIGYCYPIEWYSEPNESRYGHQEWEEDVHALGAMAMYLSLGAFEGFWASMIMGGAETLLLNPEEARMPLGKEYAKKLSPEMRRFVLETFRNGQENGWGDVAEQMREYFDELDERVQQHRDDRMTPSELLTLPVFDPIKAMAKAAAEADKLECSEQEALDKFTQRQIFDKVVTGGCKHPMLWDPSLLPEDDE